MQREKEERPCREAGRSQGSAGTDDIVTENGYPVAAMRAFVIAWWVMWAAIFAIWAVRG